MAKDSAPGPALSTPADGALFTALCAALRAGWEVKGTTSPNPPVGAAVFDPSTGEILGVGGTSPVGGPHAEVNALAAAAERARGAAIAVTLEPCAHTGRTGPCTQAILDAGIAQVFYLNPDPNAQAAGGAEVLRCAGLDVYRVALPESLPADVPGDSVQEWLRALAQEAAGTPRPAVTIKIAQTLDGYVAAADGTSQWITSAAAREFAHADRAKRDAIAVGTGTVLADNPSLTARRRDGSLYPLQPRRVVFGTTPLDSSVAPNLHAQGFTQYASLREGLAQLHAEGVRDLLIEGGPGIITACLQAGVVDFAHVYLAPQVLGAGTASLSGAVARTLADAARFTPLSLRQVGADALWILRAGGTDS